MSGYVTTLAVSRSEDKQIFLQMLYYMDLTSTNTVEFTELLYEPYLKITFHFSSSISKELYFLKT